MKTIKWMALILLISTVGLQAQTVKKVKAAPAKKIQAYYFHFISRCVTCKTVEAEANKTL